MIFVFFKPLDIKKQEFIDVPLLNIDQFTMYEFDLEGLQTVMTGKHTLRYSNRYIVDEIYFKDYSKDFISSMKADKALYKGDIIDLEGNVSYSREDGLAFVSPTLHYDTQTSIATTSDKFIAYKGKSIMEGKTLKYNSKRNMLHSKNIVIKYQLNEGK